MDGLLLGGGQAECVPSRGEELAEHFECEHPYAAVTLVNLRERAGLAVHQRPGALDAFPPERADRRQHVLASRRAADACACT